MNPRPPYLRIADVIVDQPENIVSYISISKVHNHPRVHNFEIRTRRDPGGTLQMRLYCNICIEGETEPKLREIDWSTDQDVYTLSERARKAIEDFLTNGEIIPDKRENLTTYPTN